MRPSRCSRRIWTAQSQVPRCTPSAGIFRLAPVAGANTVLLQQTQQLLAGLKRQKAPADLALKLRVAISQEAAQAKRPRLQGVMVRLENAIDAFMVPATAGLVSTVVIFGLLMGFLALPGQLQASNDDVPLMLYTAPQLQQTAFGTTLTSIGGESLVIEAYIDANGRIQDYRVLSDGVESTNGCPMSRT